MTWLFNRAGGEHPLDASEQQFKRAFSCGARHRQPITGKPMFLD